MSSTASHLDKLSVVERQLRERFSKDKRLNLPSTAGDLQSSARLDQLIIPTKDRRQMPLTKDKYIVKENPHLVAWEREVRKFLRNLTPKAGHRVAAVHIYEWATGLEIADVMAYDEKVRAEDGEPTMWRSDLRFINQILRFYFGKPYMTYIMGRKIPKAYRVPPGWYVKRHRPQTLTLYNEYLSKTLDP